MELVDVHLNERLHLDEMLRRTYLCVSLNEAETRKERISASGGKIESLCPKRVAVAAKRSSFKIATQSESAF